MVGKLSELMLGDISPTKYEDLGNQMVIVPNTLVDLATVINIMMKDIFELFGFTNLRPTPIVLELVDRSKFGLKEY